MNLPTIVRFGHAEQSAALVFRSLLPCVRRLRSSCGYLRMLRLSCLYSARTFRSGGMHVLVCAVWFGWSSSLFFSLCCFSSLSSSRQSFLLSCMSDVLC